MYRCANHLEKPHFPLGSPLFLFVVEQHTPAREIVVCHSSSDGITMSGRVRPWIRRPSEASLYLIQASLEARLYLVQERGPLSFVLNDGRTSQKVLVEIGNLHRCSCRKSLVFFCSLVAVLNIRNITYVSLGCDSVEATDDNDQCIHILFCLIKIFKLDRTNPLVWQSAFTDNDLSSILSGRANKIHAALQKKPAVPSRKACMPTGRVKHRVGETCPICHDDIVPEKQKLVYCSRSCGNSLHSRYTLVQPK